MPIVIRTPVQDGAGATATATSRTPGRPGGSVSGDLLLLSMAWSGSTVTLTDPTGWTPLHKTQQTNANLAVYARASDGTATDTPTLTVSAACTCVGTCSGFGSWDGVLPVAGTTAINTLSGSASTTIIYGGITPQTAGDLLIYITGLRPSTASTQVTAVAPAGGTGGTVTKQIDGCTNVSGSAEEETAVITQQLSAATAVTQQNATVATAVSGNIETIVITPATVAASKPQRVRRNIQGNPGAIPSQHMTTELTGARYGR